MLNDKAEALNLLMKLAEEMTSYNYYNYSSTHVDHLCQQWDEAYKVFMGEKNEEER